MKRVKVYIARGGQGGIEMIVYEEGTLMGDIQRVKDGNGMECRLEKIYDIEALEGAEEATFQRLLMEHFIGGIGIGSGGRIYRIEGGELREDYILGGIGDILTKGSNGKYIYN